MNDNSETHIENLRGILNVPRAPLQIPSGNFILRPARHRMKMDRPFRLGQIQPGHPPHEGESIIGEVEEAIGWIRRHLKALRLPEGARRYIVDDDRVIPHIGDVDESRIVFYFDL